MNTFNPATAILQKNKIVCVKSLHRGVRVCVYLVVSRSRDAEYARVLFYAALAVNGKTRGVEMNFDL